MVTIEISSTHLNTGMRIERGATMRFEFTDGIEFTVQNGQPFTPFEVYNQIGVKQKFNKPIWVGVSKKGGI